MPVFVPRQQHLQGWSQGGGGVRGEVKEEAS